MVHSEMSIIKTANAYYKSEISCATYIIQLPTTTNMKTLQLTLLVAILTLVSGCLITNCPRGGKRNGKFGLSESNIKPCISCGPGRSGQCYGANICCGPFGCLMNTPETTRCQRQGFFHEQEPCIAGSSWCRKNTGRCALDGICCTQESCHVDKSCNIDEKNRISSLDNVAVAPIDLYNLISYQNEYSNEK